MSEDVEEGAVTDMHGGIGSNRPLGTLQFTLFVPSVDRDGNAIDQEQWVEAFDAHEKWTTYAHQK